MDTQPVTVSNDLFTVTLTSSLSDENIVYLTAAWWRTSFKGL